MLRQVVVSVPGAVESPGSRRRSGCGRTGRLLRSAAAGPFPDDPFHRRETQSFETLATRSYGTSSAGTLASAHPRSSPSPCDNRELADGARIIREVRALARDERVDESWSTVSR
jgi:hypothetical protein